MKNLITTIVVYLAFMFTCQVNAQVTFSVSSTTINNGQNVCIPITVTDFTNIVSFQYSINFDETILTYTGSQGHSIPGMNASNVANPSDGNITVSWLAGDVLVGETLTDGSVAFEICFDGIGNDETSSITFSGTPSVIEVTTPDGEITPSFTNGSIQVNSVGGTPDNVAFATTTSTINNGQNTCIPITVTDFTNIVSFQYSINFDETILTYTGSQGHSIPGMNASNVANPSDGNITVSWLAGDVLVGETLTDGSVAFEICFDGIGNDETSSITFSGTPSVIEVTTPDGEITPSFTNGSIQVNSVGGTPDNVAFATTTSTINNGQNTCIPITVTDFTNIVSFQYSINFDETILTYTGSQSHNVPGMNASNVANPSDGNITVSWLAGDVLVGESLTDGSIAFEICFDGIGNDETSSITFSGTPSVIEVTTPDGEITPSFTNGSIQVNSVGGTPDNVAFATTTSTINNGQNTCIPITVTDFTNIVSFQYSINFDETILTYTGSQSHNVPGMNASNVANPSDGNITVSWLAGDVLVGESLTDGSVAFEICFDGIGNDETSSITFSGTPSVIEVTTPDGEIMPSFTNGSIQVNSVGGTPDNVAFATTTSTINNGQNTCIPITVTDFTNIVSFQYSINFDETILTYTGSQSHNVPGMNASNVANPSDGNITVSWLAGDVLVGESLTDGSIAFEICFDGIGNDETSSITFSGTPSVIEVTTPDGEIMPSFTNGSIQVNSVGGGNTDGILDFFASTESGNAGTNQCVEITTDDFDDIVSFQYSINFDHTVLSYTGSQNFALPGMDDNNIANPLDGNLTVSWLANDVVLGESLNDNAVVYEICFDLIGAANSSSDIIISGTPAIVEIYNAAGNELTPDFNSGLVSINAGGGGGNTDGILDFFASTESGNAGTNQCVEVTTDDFDDIVSFQYSINFDHTILSYTGAQNFALPGMTASNVANPSDGNLTVSWLANDVVTGESLTDDAVVYEICFDLIGAGQTNSTIVFSGAPALVEVVNTAGNEITPDFNSGQVTINAGGINTDGVLDFYAMSAAGACGENLCVDITVDDYDAIVSFQYTVNYNPAILSFTGANNFGLPGMTGNNFGNPSPGVITVSYLAGDVTNGLTIADNTVAYSLCFDLVGGLNSDSGITFSSTPAVTEIIGLNGEITAEFNEGQVTISECVNQNFPFQFIAGNTTVEDGQNTCVPITVTDFDNVVSIQYTIEFDPTNLSYTGAQNYAFSNMNNNTVVNQTNNPGHIGVSWLAEDVVNGETLLDHALLFEICFDVNGPNGDVSPISFSGEPVSIEVTGIDGSNMDPIFVPGSVTIDNTPCLAPVVNGTVTSSCSNSANGGVVLNISGGNDTYSYSWSNNTSNQNLTNVASGTYSVTVTSCGNETIETFNVTDHSDITLGFAVTNVACFGNTNGAINITVSGGDGDFDYVWTSPNGGTISNPNAEDIGGLSAAMYQVAITDGNNCTLNSAMIEVTAPSAPIQTNLSVSNNDCFGESFGEIDLNVTGGTGTLNYEWNPASLGNTGNPSLLANGSYDVTITDANNCELINNNIDVTSPVEITLEVISTTNDDGTGIGAINVSAVGTTQYSWTSDNVFIGSTLDITGLSAGTYTLVASNANGCSETITVVIEQPLSVILSDSVNACFEANDGSVDITISGGVGPYLIDWDNNGTGDTDDSEDLTGLSGGIYTVVVTDQNDEEAILAVNIQEASSALSLTIQNVVNAANGSTCDGTIQVTAMGGYDTNYDYSWNNGAFSGATLTDLCAGTYNLTLTDANGCTLTQAFEIGINPLQIMSMEATEVDCFGDDNGTLTLVVDGGMPDYSVTYGAGLPFNQTSPGVYELAGLPAGQVDVMITDNSVPPQQITTTIDVDGASAPIAITDVTIIPNVLQFGSSGGINISVEGGTEPYDYQWNFGANSQDNLNIPSGNYMVTITDANDCTYVSGGITVDWFNISAETVTEPACPNTTDGAINLEISGAIGPITYAWSNAEETQDIADLPAGTYEVTITDQHSGVFFTETYTIESESQINLAANATSQFDGGVNISCFGMDDGSAIALAEMGVEPYSYVWDDGTLGPVNSDLIAGLHTVGVTDAMGCEMTTTVLLTEPNPVSLASSNIETVDCYEGNDGSITIEAVGGSDSYDYEWSVPSTNSPTLANVPAGQYSVTLTDDNDCTLSETFNINEPAPMEIITTIVDDSGEGDGSISITINGGTPDYLYDFGNGNGLTAVSTVVGLETGLYAVMVVDANGCEALDPKITVKNIGIDCLQERTVITPNGDGLNEEFIINCLDQYPTNSLEIYNRSGQLVYETTDYQNDWMGISSRGTVLPKGVYFFVFEYMDGTTQVQRKGTVTVYR